MYEDLGDDELLTLASDRSNAFGAFYERHAEDVLRFFGRRTLDPDVAAELTAETFAQAFAARKRFRPRGAGAPGWLYGIARHQLGRYFRSGAVDARARRKLGMPDRDLSEEDYTRIEELIDLKEARIAVAQTFSSLSNEQREAMTLRVVEGRPYAEVAGMLACSEQAARARVSRGLQRLGALLERGHPELGLERRVT